MLLGTTMVLPGRPRLLLYVSWMIMDQDHLRMLYNELILSTAIGVYVFTVVWLVEWIMLLSSMQRRKYLLLLSTSCLCVWVCICVCVCVHACVRACTCLPACVHACMHACMRYVPLHASHSILQHVIRRWNWPGIARCFGGSLQGCKVFVFAIM